MVSPMKKSLCCKKLMRITKEKAGKEEPWVSRFAKYMRIVITKEEWQGKKGKKRKRSGGDVVVQGEEKATKRRKR